MALVHAVVENAKSRRWCFTDFGPKVLDCAGYFGALLPNGVRFVIWQKERCPVSGRFHVQGYLRLSNSTTLGGVKRILASDTAHVTMANGTEQQNIDYCSKDASKVEGPWCASPIQRPPEMDLTDD